MAVLLVVPLEERLAEGTAVLDAAEAIWEIRAVLQGTELAFRIRVVIGNIGSAMALGDTQIGHQKGNGLRLHDPAAIGMDSELAGRNLVLGDGFLDELLGQLRAFARRDHPTGDIT